MSDYTLVNRDDPSVEVFMRRLPQDARRARNDRVRDQRGHDAAGLRRARARRGGDTGTRRSTSCSRARGRRPWRRRGSARRGDYLRVGAAPPGRWRLGRDGLTFIAVGAQAEAGVRRSRHALAACSRSTTSRSRSRRAAKTSPGRSTAAAGLGRDREAGAPRSARRRVVQRRRARASSRCRGALQAGARRRTPRFGSAVRPRSHALAASLADAGCAVTWADPAEIPGRERFHVADPFGNRLEFLA